MADIQYYGTGRRKTSTARVYLRPGGGNVQVNHKAFEAYFPNETLRMIIRQPLNLTETTNKFDVLVNVAGGGPAGSLPASLGDRGVVPAGDGGVRPASPDRHDAPGHGVPGGVLLVVE